MSVAYEPRIPLLRVFAFNEYYAIPVLRDIDLDVHAGEVLALTGKNGASRSTLSKILYELGTAAYGSMTLTDTLYAPNSRSAAEVLDVYTVLQELSMVSTLIVAEDLFLGELPRRLDFVDHSMLRLRAKQTPTYVDLDLSLWTPVCMLGTGHRQAIEIARTLVSVRRVLIPDESTAMLSVCENATLFEHIGALRHEGVAILCISHHLNEPARIADHIIVLRDGRLVTDAPAATVMQDILIQAMIDRDMVALSETQQTVHEPWLGNGSSALRVAGLTRAPAVHDVSFGAAPGEVFGIASLVGAGRTELLRLILGTDRVDVGSVEVGPPLAPARVHSPGDAVRHGISLLTKDRKDEGPILSLPITTNIALGSVPGIAKQGQLQSAHKRVLAQRHIGTLHIRHARPERPVSELSGDNRQKVVITRWLEHDTPALLFDEPTRGVDVGAKLDTYTLLNVLAARGKVLVVVSSDLRELTQLCDRIGVMRAGRFTHISQCGGWSQDVLFVVTLGESEEPNPYASQSSSGTVDVL